MDKCTWNEDTDVSQNLIGSIRRQTKSPVSQWYFHLRIDEEFTVIFKYITVMFYTLLSTHTKMIICVIRVSLCIYICIYMYITWYISQLA